MKKIHATSSIYLRPAELTMLMLVSFVSLTDIILVASWKLSVAYDEYIITVAASLLLMCIGLIYRGLNRSETIAVVTICTSLMVAFTSAMALLNYVFLPNHRIGLDQWLLQFDAVFGYNWADMVRWSVHKPILNELMRYAYLSSLPQMVVLILMLGLGAQIRRLHVMLMTLMLSASLAVVFWILFPTAGPSAYLMLDQETASISHQVLDKAYGKKMLDLLVYGEEQIRPSQMIGLIAFPSYHTVLALVGIWFSRSLKWMFPVFLIVNLLVFPATLAHGGHYLIDLAGGLILFLICLWGAELFQRRFDRQEKPEINLRPQRTSMSHPA
ncbi:phosphatase PAP2 family protein [Pseudochrobactrum sp. sp1633]|uniref:phosphatase PAP2 family protein n=1 Tax=Pseudochrobactrum sp. sp1633 TaxID=3036706 RepID=UPI0025A55F17|nr:phosphatase PAP2 family protein [Pseudochrobactrum sp. sp1633]MDM8346145.1 phosphatase PAP2 family protein [Pseudochrobactrum sp. sp1633]HWD13790.1 phosphatase PAP2 family protein [Pseudochrobactrum sp.]